MTQEFRDAIRQVLMGENDYTRSKFTNSFSEEVEEFIEAMVSAVEEWVKFNSRNSEDECRGKISNLIFCSVNGNIVAMDLFLTGHVIPSGNAQRQVLEVIAMAVLASKPDLGFLERFSQDRCSTNKAIRDVLRNSDELEVNKDSIRTIQESAEFYHKFSHPSLMTIALNSSFADPNNTYLGGFFDEGKLPQYKKEIVARVKLAKILPNLIQGIESNLSG